jgi:hypothetical protein
MHRKIIRRDAMNKSTSARLPAHRQAGGNKYPGLFFVLFLAVALTFSCMGSYGKLVSNSQVLDQYRTNTLPETFQYYYCGRSGLPYAVVGIDETIRFNDRIWFKIDSMKEVYAKIHNLSDLHPGATRMGAADILDPGGNRIGVWFSYYHHTPVRINPQTGVLEIFNPYDPTEDDPGGL